MSFLAQCYAFLAGSKNKRSKRPANLNGEIAMKVAFLTSALAAFLAVGCGSAMESAKGESTLKQNAPITCSIQTHFGGYLTAVGGGGKTYDAIHADATQVRSWERLTIVDTGDGNHVGIQTMNGRFLTAVGGGGRITDVIHTTATSIGDNEKFELWSLGGGLYTLKTIRGFYLGHAGQSPDVLHSDARVANSWEQFRFNCGI
jgi:hypothetical protein